jgi:hypothetical protein
MVCKMMPIKISKSVHGFTACNETKSWPTNMKTPLSYNNLYGQLTLTKMDPFDFSPESPDGGTKRNQAEARLGTSSYAV